MTAPSRIVVLGAGYAGLATAKLLGKRTAATVTLVNNRDWFAERMRNHQRATGRKLRHLQLHDLLEGTGTSLVVDRVTGIDPERRQVGLASGAEPVGYDLLVYALGSHADLDSVPGAADHAYAVANAEHATRLSERMRTAGTVTVVGGGLTGIEAVTELAERYPDRKVKLATSGALMGGSLSEHGREYLHRKLEKLGVQVWEHARVAEVGADGLILADGTHVSADTVAWTTGFKVPALAREAGLAVDDRGRMLVDGTLRSVSHPDVYGIGDAAAGHNRDGKVLRMGCGPGGLTVACAFRAINDRMAGRTPGTLRVDEDTLCVSLGQRDGLLQRTDLDGNPVGKARTGRPVAAMKKFVLRVTGSYTPRYPAMVLAGTRK